MLEKKWFSATNTECNPSKETREKIFIDILSVLVQSYSRTMVESCKPNSLCGYVFFSKYFIVFASVPTYPSLLMVYAASAQGSPQYM